MIPNLFDLPMPNQAVSQLQVGSFANVNTGKSSLFLFSPRNVPNQVRRPHIYKFGGEFRMDLQETISKSLNHSTNHQDTLMLNYPHARSAILPSAMGMDMNLAAFSDFWTFILILDNVDQKSAIGYNSTIPTRMMYSGWIMDEPVTKTFGGGTAHNPNCIFTISHHITMALQQQMTPQGTFYKTDTTGDYDYVSGQLLQQIHVGGDALYELNPANLVNNITEDPSSMGNNFTIAPVPVMASHANHRTGMTSALEIPTELNNPTAHLQKIVQGMSDSVKMSHYGNDAGMVNDIFSGGDVILSTMGSMLKSSQNAVLQHLDPGKPITFGELEFRYGAMLEVVVCRADQKTSPYEIGCSLSPTKRNVFTSVVSSSIPPLLAQFGLAEIAFRYNSRVSNSASGIFNFVNAERGVFELLNLSTLYQTSEQSQASAWDQLKYYLNMTLFPIIKENAGDFDLMLHCSLAGVSLVDLQLLDEVRDYGIIESNNLLGGINTSLVGNWNAVQSNSEQLFTVAKDLSAPGTLGTGYPPNMGEVQVAF